MNAIYNERGLITLKNEYIITELSPLGAALCRVLLPNGLGGFTDVAMALAHQEDAFVKGSYSGTTLGPNAGRIKGAALSINETEYNLSENDGNNELHGGFMGFSGKRWRTAFCGNSSVVFSLEVPDGEGGYPGNRCITVAYTLEGRSLNISYRAATTKPTWLNISNHVYWNLTGDFKKTALNHQLQISAERVLYNDTEHIPVLSKAVSDSPFDFLKPVSIAENIRRFPEHQQLKNARGYNNAFIFNNKPCVSLTDPASSRSLILTTDYPCVVFYSGGYLDESVSLLCGCTASSACALAFEAQELPDTPHLKPELCPNAFPQRIWQRFIRFDFSFKANDMI